jgi:transposase
MFDVPGIHVLWVEIDDRQRLVVTVESDQLEAGCPSCGVVAAGYGRRVHPLHDAPCFDRVTLVRWRKRIWRCREPMCATTTFRGAHDLTWPRAVLTTRAVEWAADALTHDDTNVSALGRWRYGRVRHVGYRLRSDRVSHTYRGEHQHALRDA